MNISITDNEIIFKFTLRDYSSMKVSSLLKKCRSLRYDYQPEKMMLIVFKDSKSIKFCNKYQSKAKKYRKPWTVKGKSTNDFHGFLRFN